MELSSLLQTKIYIYNKDSIYEEVLNIEQQATTFGKFSEMVHAFEHKRIQNEPGIVQYFSDNWFIPRGLVLGLHMVDDFTLDTKTLTCLWSAFTLPLNILSFVV
jgi:hypothetical protein